MRNDVRGVFENIEDDEALIETEEPETLVTDAQAAKIHRVFDKVHVAAKKDIDMTNTIVEDIQ
jgi:hypothetical protein